MASDPPIGFSRSEMEHTLEMAAARHPRLSGAPEKVGWPSRARGRTMDDAALIAKLAELGAHVDRAWLDQQSRAHSSAEEIAASLHAGIPDRGQERNWLWVCLAVLWERWFPDRPNPEMLDDKMQDVCGPRGKGPMRRPVPWVARSGPAVGLGLDRLGILLLHAG